MKTGNDWKSADLEGARRLFQAEGAAFGKGSVVGGMEVFWDLCHNPMKAAPFSYCDII